MTRIFYPKGSERISRYRCGARDDGPRTNVWPCASIYIPGRRGSPRRRERVSQPNGGLASARQRPLGLNEKSSVKIKFIYLIYYTERL